MSSAAASSFAWIIRGNNCSLIDCVANNSNIGFNITFSSDCYCFNCEANQNNLIGFLGDKSSKLILDSCRGLNNSRDGGFLMSEVTDCCITNCLAKENGNNGFWLIPAERTYLKNNIAIGNTVTGYLVTGTDNVLLSNYAEANGTNYSGITDPITTYTISNGLFSPIAFPSIWQNIDAQP